MQSNSDQYNLNDENKYTQQIAASTSKIKQNLVLSLYQYQFNQLKRHTVNNIPGFHQIEQS